MEEPPTDERMARERIFPAPPTERPRPEPRTRGGERRGGRPPVPTSPYHRDVQQIERDPSGRGTACGTPAEITSACTAWSRAASSPCGRGPPRRSCRRHDRRGGPRPQGDDA